MSTSYTARVVAHPDFEASSPDAEVDALLERFLAAFPELTPDQPTSVATAFAAGLPRYAMPHNSIFPEFGGQGAQPVSGPVRARAQRRTGQARSCATQRDTATGVGKLLARLLAHRAPSLPAAPAAQRCLGPGAPTASDARVRFARLCERLTLELEPDAG